MMDTKERDEKSTDHTNILESPDAIISSHADPNNRTYDEGDEKDNVSSDNSEDENARPKCFNSTLQECLCVLACTMAIGQASFFAGTIIGVTALIGQDLGMSTAEITWLSAAVDLSAGCFLLFFGKMADMFGRKHLFIVSMASFSIFLVIMGFIHNPIVMVTFSGLIGLCSAASVPPAVGILGVAYLKPSRRKNAAFSVFSSGNPVGFALGSVVSGITTRILDWRASFWFLAIVYTLFTLIAIWTVPKDSFKREDFNVRTLIHFDYLGTLLIIAGVALFSGSLTLAGDAPHGFATGYVLITLIIGSISLCCFIVWQHVYRHPLLTPAIWRDRNFSLVMGMLCLNFMAFTSGTFWISLYLQRIKKSSAIHVAVQLLPQAIAGIIVNMILSLVLHRLSKRLLMGFACLALTTAYVLLSLMEEECSYWAFLFPALLLTATGMDISFNIANLYVMSSTPPNQQSLAGGIFNTLIKLCINVGLGISTLIYSKVNKPVLTIKPYSAIFYFCAVSSTLAIILNVFLKLKS
ncbi:major facilitator superfamily domain-containing protein [Xylogone sp. PMI_703]|nr:major facilitator superfamily domain-containing protein [Xylogone sp. PMI_703]